MARQKLTHSVPFALLNYRSAKGHLSFSDMVCSLSLAPLASLNRWQDKSTAIRHETGACGLHGHPRRRVGPRLPGAPHRATLFVCKGARRFGVGAHIAVDVVVAVTQHCPGRANGPSDGISRNR